MKPKFLVCIGLKHEIWTQHLKRSPPLQCGNKIQMDVWNPVNGQSFHDASRGNTEIPVHS